MRLQLAALDTDIESLMATLRREQPSGRLSDTNGSVHIAVKQLFQQLERIRTKAASSESTVREITGEIRTLDTAKNNLVGSITALKRLQMLGEQTIDSARNKSQALCSPPSLLHFPLYRGRSSPSADAH